MARYRNKPRIIEAVQWFPGLDIPGVVVEGRKLHISADGNAYYATWLGCRAQHWLSVAAHEGDAPESLRAESFRGAVQYAADGRRWYRMSWPFMFYDFRSGVVEDVGGDSPLFLDYAAAEQWPADPLVFGWVTTIQGQRVKIHPGEWVVTESDGVHHYPIKADEFDVLYEAVGESSVTSSKVEE